MDSTGGQVAGLVLSDLTSHWSAASTQSLVSAVTEQPPQLALMSVSGMESRSALSTIDRKLADLAQLTVYQQHAVWYMLRVVSGYLLVMSRALSC
jgi:hypothetical protein